MYRCDPKAFAGNILLYKDLNRPDGADIIILCQIAELPPKKIQEIFKALVKSFAGFYPPAGPTSTAEARLAQVNFALAPLLLKFSSENKLACVLIELKENELAIATYGGVMAGLIRQGQFLKLASEEKQNKPKPNHAKPVVNFKQGRLDRGDVLIAALANVFNAISLDQLKKIVSASKGQRAADKILDVVKAGLKPSEPILGIIWQA